MLASKKIKLMTTTPYTLPRICRGPEWFIEFYYDKPDQPGKKERFKWKCGLNRIKDVSEREIQAEALRRQILKELKEGKVPSRQVKVTLAKKTLLVDTLTTIAAQEGVGKSLDTRRAYTLMIGRLQKFITHIEMPEMLLEEFSTDKAEDFKVYLVEEMDLKNVSVNCTIQPLKMFLETLFVKKKIPINPFYYVKYLPKHRGSTFIAFDAREKKLIRHCLEKNHPELYLFTNFIYTCFMRPKEVTALTPGDIDFTTGFVLVRIETSKVAHTSYRQLTPDMIQLLRDYGIDNMPKNKIIFEEICGDDKDLRVRRRRVSELWKKIIKEGLGIDKEMYGAKHTGNIDYLKNLKTVNEANLLWLMQQNDHKTLETTQHYIRDLGVYKMTTDDLPFGKL